jgi:GT2 family glycosyltransferase
MAERPGTPADPPPRLPPSSLIVCSRNRQPLLLDTVRSVLDGTTLPVELIVIDQSDQPAPALAALHTDRPCEIRYLWTRSVGVSKARNAGIDAARHELLAFTDDDVFVAPGWFGALIGALVAAGPRAVVTGRVLATAAETPGAFAPALVDREEPAVYAGRIGRDVLEAGNMALFRAAVARVGGFDPRLGPGTPFPAGEDNDYGLRLLAAGYAIHYVPEATIYHRAWRGRRAYLPLRWRYGIGQGAYYAKHLRLRDRYMLRRLGRLLLHQLRVGLRRVRREPRQGLGHVVYILGVLAGIGKWFLTRASGQGRRP